MGFGGSFIKESESLNGHGHSQVKAEPAIEGIPGLIYGSISIHCVHRLPGDRHFQDLDFSDSCRQNP